MIDVIVEKTKTGFSAFFLNITGTGTTGQTIEQIKERIPLTYDMYLKGLAKDNEINDYGYQEELSHFKGESIPQFKYFIEEG